MLQWNRRRSKWAVGTLRTSSGSQANDATEAVHAVVLEGGKGEFFTDFWWREVVLQKLNRYRHRNI